MPPKNTSRFNDRVTALLDRYCLESGLSKNAVITAAVIDSLRAHYGADFVREWLAEGDGEEATEE